MSLFVTIVLDGVGIGAQPDAGEYGDQGAHTLGHVCAAARPNLPNLATFGLGCIAPLEGVPPTPAPAADFGRLLEVSAGKDSTSGHWELAGIRLDHPFPTYPDGFPPDVIATFLEQTGCTRVLGNKAASGTAIIEELGPAHQQTGHPIVYTSADSVFQIAAHTGVVSLGRLYRWCQIARDAVCVGKHAVGRVIARPFAGLAGQYERISARRKDFSHLPPSPPVQQVLQDHGVHTVSIGKVADLFGGIGFDRSVKTTSNAEGIARTLESIRALGTEPGHHFVWVNLVDFDQEFGHRNDPIGFAAALEAFDRALPALARALPADAHLVITADHGNDPTMPSTDHSREYVPLLSYRNGQPAGRNLGRRSTFSDHAASVAVFFGVPFACPGTSFLGN